MVQLKTLGTENLKKLVDYGIRVGDQITVAESDGKWTWSDSFGFIDEIMDLPGVIKSGKTAGEELLDLDEEERQEINNYVIEKYNTPSEHAQDIVEKSFNTVFALMALVSAIKAAKAAGMKTR